MNIKKTCYMPFSCNAAGCPTFDCLHLEGDTTFEILPVKTYKYLGVIIDCHLRWDIHVNSTVKKLRSILYIFRRLKPILLQRYLRTLYFALVESHIRYGIAVWGGALHTHLKPIEIMQRRFLKLIYSRDGRYPSDALYEEADVLDVRSVHRYDTRCKDHFVAPLMVKRTTQRSYSFFAPRMYNRLPEEVKSLRALHLFKKYVKKYLLTTNRREILNIFN
ncbi:uncharacterized protein LOC123310729 [Coccinella septempunctata]|uniref:uncharacterized protein LOC123310729 n=1 Tax=Coccinella septempunctata TaxID=41139 RepID=UPI001D08A7F3|nr:uncharacterized protein LOC123310729 [Coccinella septempunctata]